MKKVLFITWDGPQTSYMEGLFMPIFNAVQNQTNVEFHVIQFTWGSAEKVEITREKARQLNIIYHSIPVLRKPIVILGNAVTLFKGIKQLKNYISQYNIDIVMPRSTMPSVMVNRLKASKFKLVFDADGLPLEERVDFSGLKKNSSQYQFFKREENKILTKADAVITRSRKSIDVHLKTIPSLNSEKFSVVLNGRDPDFFKPNQQVRDKVRQSLNIEAKAKVFVYCGSLGPQYGWQEMIAIFQEYFQNHNDAKFVILTGNVEFAQERIPSEIKDSIIVKKVPFEQVPTYLSAADVAFAIREPKFSMQGVAPIKLGEYLLMGIPTIASKGIGDTEEILDSIPNCLLFDHNSSESIGLAVTFAEGLKEVNHEHIRDFGIKFFSIAKSAESYIKSITMLINVNKNNSLNG